ncbi:YARHG domain-containing protein [Flammeovirga aprica]|uniref:YARHG domain-containing protein n=1 Tax=Flammeovirga aprica JL-4 TaxID=694437 RepID=A0A7X9RZV6_9BACT|nr:YARHG domain-containing protein [Flammeovirga aprica]NME71749.1 YARHG domain-containing protein [Flammeovirga aprica JL-4]
MKKYFLLFFVVFNISTVLGQESNLSQKIKDLKVNTKLPNDIAEKYFEATKDYSGEFQPCYLKYKRQCDSLIYIIIDHQISLGSYSSFYIIKNKIVSEYSLGFSFDSDGANAKSTSASYRFIHEEIIEIIATTEVVADSSMYDEHFNMKFGLSSHNQKMNSHDSYSYLKINECRIEELVPSKSVSEKRKFKIASTRLLKKEDLQTLSYKELKLMRNEIFAGHGYIFQSADLKKYFSQFDWYKPEKAIVSEDELSEIERLNIQLIKEFEIAIK